MDRIAQSMRDDYSVDIVCNMEWKGTADGVAHPFSRYRSRYPFPARHADSDSSVAVTVAARICSMLLAGDVIGAPLLLGEGCGVWGVGCEEYEAIIHCADLRSSIRTGMGRKVGQRPRVSDSCRITVRFSSACHYLSSSI
jgi:hypothetical protein